MRLLSIWIVVLAFGLLASISAEPPAVKTQADTDHPVALRTGEELILTLNSNHSTGYRWIRTDTETPVLVTLGKPAYKTGGRLLGASGTELWNSGRCGTVHRPSNSNIGVPGRRTPHLPAPWSSTSPSTDGRIKIGKIQNGKEEGLFALTTSDSSSLALRCQDQPPCEGFANRPE